MIRVVWFGATNPRMMARLVFIILVVISIFILFVVGVSEKIGVRLLGGDILI